MTSVTKACWLTLIGALLANGQPASQPFDYETSEPVLIYYDSENNGPDGYRFEYALDDGTKRKEDGSFVDGIWSVAWNSEWNDPQGVHTYIEHSPQGVRWSINSAVTSTTVSTTPSTTTFTTVPTTASTPTSTTASTTASNAPSTTTSTTNQFNFPTIFNRFGENDDDEDSLVWGHLPTSSPPTPTSEPPMFEPPSTTIPFDTETTEGVQTTQLTESEEYGTTLDYFPSTTAAFDTSPHTTPQPSPKPQGAYSPPPTTSRPYTRRPPTTAITYLPPTTQRTTTSKGPSAGVPSSSYGAPAGVGGGGYGGYSGSGGGYGGGYGGGSGGSFGGGIGGSFGGGAVPDRPTSRPIIIAMPNYKAARCKDLYDKKHKIKGISCSGKKALVGSYLS